MHGFHATMVDAAISKSYNNLRMTTTARQAGAAILERTSMSTDRRASGALAAPRSAVTEAVDAILESWRRRHGLTEAEVRVLEHLIRGLSNKEIAHELGRRTSTVRSQVASVLRKLEIDSRVRLVYRAFEETMSSARREPA